MFFVLFLKDPSCGDELRPEDIYLTLKKGYDAAEIPVRGWEPDNNIDADFHGDWDSTSKNWIGHDLGSRFCGENGVSVGTSCSRASVPYLAAHAS